MNTASNQSDKASAISQARPAADRYLQILREELPETYDHSIRVMEYCMLYTAYSGMPRDEAMELTTAALLHDIGKLDVPKSIIEKPGRLTHDEFEEVKRHPIVGYEIARSIGLPDDVCDAIILHHRNVDDSGYPSTHKHANTYARIIHIIDVYGSFLYLIEVFFYIIFYFIIWESGHKTIYTFKFRIINIFIIIKEISHTIFCLLKCRYSFYNIFSI